MKNTLLAFLILIANAVSAEWTCAQTYLFWDREFMASYLLPEVIKEKNVNEMKFVLKTDSGMVTIQNIKFSNGFISLDERYREGEVSYSIFYDLDEQGRPISERMTYPNFLGSGDWEMPQTDYTYGKNRMEWQERGAENVVLDKSKTSWGITTYDDLGRVLEQKREYNYEDAYGINSSSSLLQYDYDDKNHTCNVSFFHNGELLSNDLKTYDKNWNELESKSYNPDGEFQYGRTSQYTENSSLKRTKIEHKFLCESSEFGSITMEFKYTDDLLSGVNINLDDLSFEVLCFPSIYSKSPN